MVKAATGGSTSYSSRLGASSCGRMTGDAKTPAAATTMSSDFPDAELLIAILKA